MTINEASEQYNIPISILREYESWGLCDTVKTAMGVWQYDDEDIERSGGRDGAEYRLRREVGPCLVNRQSGNQIITGGTHYEQKISSVLLRQRHHG